MSVKTESFEEEDPNVVKIFINNVDLYQSKAICVALNADSENKQKYEIYGTVQNMKDAKMKVIKSMVTQILYHCSLDYVCDIIKCDILIYDIGSEQSPLTEVEQIINIILKKLKTAPNEVNVKYFILISNPLTWARTKNINDDNMLYETDYRKRCAHPNFLKHKCIEREVNMLEKRTKCQIRTLIVCPGFTYGGMNDVFHYIFKLAFYNKEMIPVIAPGNQIIPLIYIGDFARMIKQLVENFPEPEVRYVFAVEPKFRRFINFVRQITKSLAGTAAKTKVVSKPEFLKLKNDLFEQRIIDVMTSEMKMKPIYFENFNFTFINKEFENLLAEEFRIARNFIPIKILIDGPPCVGKTVIANQLRKYYDLIYITIDTLLEDAVKEYEKSISEAKSFISDLKIEKATLEDQVVEENDTYIREAEENIENFALKLKDLMEFLNNNIGNKFLLTKQTLIYKLSSKMCKENQGYIIDGFPYDYAHANEIFSEDENDNNEENSKPGRKYDIKPNNVVILDAPNDVLIARAMKFDNETALKLGYTEEIMEKNLELYRDRNEEENSLISFFHDINIIPIIICVNMKTKIVGVLDSIKHEIGLPHKYPFSKEEELLLKEVEDEKRMHEAREMKRAQEEIGAKIKAEREAKLKNWTKEFERLKNEEEASVEAKTLPLRYYLSKYVLPTLTEGILKTAELKPEDPVDFLAEFFFKNNPTGHVLPSTYNNELKELLLTDGNEDPLTILKELADNETELNCSNSK